MAADIVGYSRLIEADEPGTLVAIKDLRREVIDPVLSEHNGRIAKLMGDGVIVEFSSVVDAVSCAVAIRQEVSARQTGIGPERREREKNATAAPLPQLNPLPRPGLSPGPRPRRHRRASGRTSRARRAPSIAGSAQDRFSSRSTSPAEL